MFMWNIPAVAFDCWALESLMREKVMREASSNGFDTWEYRWATLPEIQVGNATLKYAKP